MLGLLKKRNIAGGDFLFGERLQLARILRLEDITDIERTKMIIECLHDKKISDAVAAYLIPYALDIADAFIAWLQREERECTVESLPEAKQAGIDQLNEQVGDMGNVVALAERFGFTFEQVYKMPYLDVFTIWKTDAAITAYNRRLNKILENNAKKRK